MHPIKDVKNTFKITPPKRKPEKPLTSKKEVKRYAAKSGIARFFGIIFEYTIGHW